MFFNCIKVSLHIPRKKNCPRTQQQVRVPLLFSEINCHERKRQENSKKNPLLQATHHLLLLQTVSLLHSLQLSHTSIFVGMFLLQSVSLKRSVLAPRSSSAWFTFDAFSSLRLEPGSSLCDWLIRDGNKHIEVIFKWR